MKPEESPVLEIEGIRVLGHVGSEYDIYEQIGSGSFGEVYRAMRLSDRQIVVLKKVLEIPYPKVLREEFDILKNLSAKAGGSGCYVGIVCYYDIFCTPKPMVSPSSKTSDDYDYYVVMQYLPGTDLFDVMVEFDRRGLRMSDWDFARMMVNILKTFDYIHSRGVAHMDVKLENIRASEGTFYIIDFGLSCMLPVKPCKPSGTRGYMAPELYVDEYMEGKFLQGNPVAYMASDIWSLGITFFSLVAADDVDRWWPKNEDFVMDVVRHYVYGTAELPKRPDSILDPVLRRVDPKLARILKFMLIVDHKERPTANELIQRIESEYMDPKNLPAPVQLTSISQITGRR